MDMLLDSKLDLSHSLQGPVPATFQFVGHQAVFRIRRIVLFLCASRKRTLHTTQAVDELAPETVWLAWWTTKITLFLP